MTRLVFYAINGTGLGHLTRLLAIARSARELLHTLGERADIRFITTSDGSEIAGDFPVYKVPSKLSVRQTQIDPADFLSASRMLVLNLVAQLRPHCLVLDTAPFGAFQEASMLKGLARSMIFVDRHKDPQVAQSSLHQTHLALYDRILVPDEEGEAQRYPLESTLLDRRRFVGCVSAFQPETALSRDQVRAYFGVPPGKRLIYVSAGGGGDPESRQGLQHLVEVLAQDPRNRLLVGYGPLHRGPQLYRGNVIPLNLPEASGFFLGLDAAVSAAGYNSYQELLDAGVPTVFYAQPKGMDRQDERLRLGLERRWHLAFPAGELSALEPVLIHSTMESLFTVSLEQRPRSGGALRAAVELLALRASQPGCWYSRRHLFEAAQMRSAFAAAGFARAWQCLSWWRKLTLLPAVADEETEKAALAWQSAGQPTASQISWGARLADFQSRLEMPDERFKKGLAAWCHEGAGDRSHEERLRRQLDAVLDEVTGRLWWAAVGGLRRGDFRSGLLLGLELPEDRICQWLEERPRPVTFSEMAEAFTVGAER